MDYEKLGDNIRNYREQQGFTQEKLAELSNISEKHLSKIERGKINIKIDTLVNIADALGTSVDKLLLDASSYVEPDYISQITYHLSKLSREDQGRQENLQTYRVTRFGTGGKEDLSERKAGNRSGY